MCIVFKNRPRKIIKHGNTRYELKIIRKSLGLNHRSTHKTLNDALAHRNELERQVNQVNQGHHQPLNKPQDSIENKLKKLKDLYDQDLIFKEIYDQQQLEILSEWNKETAAM
tara:strand:+ start:34631 stop:34966 length:336 start_codon:yes stop_codon:yes gene_type:complete